MSKAKPYNQDFRKNNSVQHLFYTKFAIKNLYLIDKVIEHFASQSHCNTLGFVEVLRHERERLCSEAATYAEAQEILESIGLGKPGKKE